MSHPFGRQPDAHDQDNGTFEIRALADHEVVPVFLVDDEMRRCDEQLSLAMAEVAYPPAPLWVIWLALAVLAAVVLLTAFVK